MERPDFIRHWTELEDDGSATYPGDNELFSFGAPLGRALGLTRLGIHHERLPPGRRTSYPHAESSEEEFIFVLEGTPDAWINGRLHPLRPGDAVAFPAGTGICHTFINNSDSDVRLLVIGEANKAENRIHYPLHPEFEARRKDGWTDVPRHPFGCHDGKPDRVSRQPEVLSDTSSTAAGKPAPLPSGDN
ncbi:cupin domain-containing protein [Biostraticola tofi]|uniref:Putative cupin superfamily protein n=1 Tax=Biostraticola tofi TaxID=466109 RepID=A0A4R3YJM1_9GAMM|nr:cupin domain-containing protein [Biostraticola tofi]TCV92647.1 putative cupin superfamily protein [Biostraticola tofi]